MKTYRVLPLWCNVSWVPPRKKVPRRGFSHLHRGGVKKISDEQVRELRTLPSKQAYALGARLGVHHTTVCHIRRGRTRAHVLDIPKKADGGS